MKPSPLGDPAIWMVAALELARERGWATLATDSAGGHAWAFTREGQVAIHEAEERIARASALPTASVTASQSSPARAGANGEREHHERERGTGY